MLFAHAVLVQETGGRIVRYSTDNESAILVTISEDLVIVLPASKNEPAIYVDVPLKNIDDVTVATLEDSSQLSPLMDRTVVALSIQMFQSPESSSYTNAVERLTRSIDIAFDTAEAAESLQRSLVTSYKEQLQVSQSASGINISQVQANEIDELALSDGYKEILEHPRGTISDAGAVPIWTEQSSARVVVSKSEKEVDVSQAQLAQLINTNDPPSFSPDPERLMATAMQVLPELSIAVSNALDIGARYTENLGLTEQMEPHHMPLNGCVPVLQDQIISGSAWIASSTDASHEKSHVNHAQAIKQAENHVKSKLKSSILWQGDRPVIECAPEIVGISAQQNNQVVEGEATRHSINGLPAEHRGDGPSLYEASPAALHSRPQQAIQSSEQSGNNFPPENPSKDIFQPLPASNSGKTSSEKLIHRLRNTRSDMNAEMSLLKPPTSVRCPKNENDSNSINDISVSSNAKKTSRRGQKPRQDKQLYNGTRSTINRSHASADFDVYEMPDSPPLSNGSPEVSFEAAITKKNSNSKKGQAGRRFHGSRIPLAAAASSITRHSQVLSSHQGTLTLNTNRKTIPKSKVIATDLVDWNEDLESTSKKLAGKSRKGQKKAIKGKPIAGTNGIASKSTNADSACKRAEKDETIPPHLIHRRTMRAAALTANMKIHGIAEFDVNEKEEPLDTRPNRHDGKASAARKGDIVAQSKSPGPRVKLRNRKQKDAPDIRADPPLAGKQSLNESALSLDSSQEAIEPIAHELPQKINPSDKVDLIKDSESKRTGQSSEQNTTRKESPKPITLTLKGGLDLTPDKEIDFGGVDILPIENTHFRDTMVFTDGDNLDDCVSPVYKDDLPVPVAEHTSERNRTLELRHYSPRHEDKKDIEKQFNPSASEAGSRWANKLIGALSDIPKLSGTCTSPNTTSIGEHNQIRDKPHATPKAHTSKLSTHSSKLEGATKGVLESSLPRHKTHKRLDRRTYHLTIPESDSKGRELRPLELPADGNSAIDVPHARPTSKQDSAIRLAEAKHISSGMDESFEESFVPKPEVSNGPASEFLHANAHAASVNLAVSRAVDPQRPLDITQLAEVSAPQSGTKVGLMKPSRVVIGLAQSNRASMRNLPNMTPERTAQHTHTSDLHRKVNLISFSAKGPQNQGILSGDRNRPLGSNGDRDHRLMSTGKLQYPHLMEVDQVVGEVHPENLYIMQPHMSAADGRQASEVTSSYGSSRAGKLASKLQRVKPVARHDQVPVTLPLARPAPLQDDQTGIEAPGVESQMPARSSVAVAYMGYKHVDAAFGNKVDAPTRILNAVSTKMPSTAVNNRNLESSPIHWQAGHSRPRQTKRHADEQAVSTLNEVALGKRRKLSFEAPFEKQTTPRSASRRTSPVVQDFWRRKGSQSNKVDDNGSPLPYVPTRHSHVAESESRGTQDVIRLPPPGRSIRGQQNIALLSDIAKDKEANTKFCQGCKAMYPNKTHPNMASNNKLLPSSPNDNSSIIDEMEPHHIDPSGKLVNLETERAITLQEPPDPFVGMARIPATSFMDALRQANDRPSNIVKNYDDRLDEDEQDLDNTLVAQDLRDGSSETASQASLTSENTTSKDKSSSEKASRREYEAGMEHEWRKTLQPHNGNTLDILYDISHVSPASHP